MKDMLDREIEVGDTIVYTSAPYSSPMLTIGRVTSVLGGTVEVERIHTSYRSLRDGVVTKMMWDETTKTYNDVTLMPRRTRIGCPSRCYILDKAP